jgi:hypothetical protein
MIETKKVTELVSDHALEIRDRLAAIEKMLEIDL